MRLLFVSPTFAGQGGRAMLTRLHRDVLQALLCDGVASLPLERRPAAPLHRLAGRIDGATPSGIAAIVAALDAQGADTLWLDGSNLGRIAQGVRRARPGVRILTFCHNVEARFFLGAFRRDRSARAAGVMIGNYVAERLALRHSDDVIALSRRDSDGLRRLYGRPADAILPMTLADQATPPAGDGIAAANAPLLFVGGAFYANRDGVAWYARTVAPRLPRTIVQVVGHGMEEMCVTLASTPNIEVLGAVDQLAPCYRNAKAVIAPIFDGSGMKTKVAEALMFGKSIIGTPEAFSGYADDVIAANRCCADAAAFVAAIREIGARPLPAWDAAMRALYDRDHSPTAARMHMAALLGIEAA